MSKAPSNTNESLPEQAGPHRRNVLRGGLSLIALLVTQAIQGRRGFAQTQEPAAALPSPVIGVGVIGIPIKKDLVADFGGSLDAWSAWFNGTDAPITLTIPAGSYSTTGYIAGKGRQCVIEGAGADVVNLTVGSMFGSPGPPSNMMPGYGYPRFADANIGDTSITLLNPRDLANEPGLFVGQWVVLMCLDLQGYGYPQNNYFTEYQQITDINTETGVISFAPSTLRHKYVAHYPSWTKLRQPVRAGRRWVAHHPSDGRRPSNSTKQVVGL